MREKNIYRIFRTIRCTSPPQIWEENGGASYSPNVAYLARWGGGKAVEQGFFPYFPPLKRMCVLWSSASYSLKNMVSVASRTLLDGRSNPQPKHVPWLGTEPATPCFVGWRPTNWGTLVRSGMYSWWILSVGINFWKACISLYFVALHYFSKDFCPCGLSFSLIRVMTSIILFSNILVFVTLLWIGLKHIPLDGWYISCSLS